MHQTTVAPVRAAELPQTPPDRAAALADAEYAALLTLLRDLASEDWEHPTDCTGWSVRDVVAHTIGALDEAAHPLTLVRHVLNARRRHGHLALLDGINAEQVNERRDWPVGRLIDELARLIPAGIRGRRRMPNVVRRITPSTAPLPAGAPLSYLFDVIYTRDVWMHRLDIARAVGCQFETTFAGREVVQQVVRDLARHWDGPPLILHLTGPHGGAWALGTEAPITTVRADAVEYCRLLSGRSADLHTAGETQPAAKAALERARVLF